MARTGDAGRHFVPWKPSHSWYRNRSWCRTRSTSTPRQAFDEVSIAAYEEAIGRVMTRETFDSYTRPGNSEVHEQSF